MEGDTMLPSSPPHATTSYIPDSPFFEPQYHAFSSKSSSPPPLFSSDDSRESADVANYESPRIFKNKRKGRWWDNSESAPGTPELKKAKMTRDFDSGVYMMSDNTDSSETLPLQHKSPFGLDGTDDIPSHDEPVAPTVSPESRMSNDERVFCSKMYDGLERNSETYDFSSCDLQDTDIRRIGELASVIKNAPDPGNELPVEGQYRSMVPELYVNLNDNHLRHLTPSLFEVQNLTTLVLVGNDFEELPPQISQLRNLKELNISQNNIKWLPFEFLQLFGLDGRRGSLEIMGDSGVPWLEPKVRQESGGLIPTSILRNAIALARQQKWDSLPHAITNCVKQLHQYLDSEANREKLLWRIRILELHVAFVEKLRTVRKEEEDGVPHHPTIHLTPGPLSPRYIARTPVSYSDEAGAVVKGSPKSPCSNDDDFSVLTDTLRGMHGVPSSWFTPPKTKAINSLATMTVHTALRHKDHEDLTIQDLRDHIGEPIPPTADAILKQAELNNRGGYGEFKKCHICSKEYVIARAEWIEWWWLMGMRVFPLKLQVCSWTCVPDAMLRRPERELVWD